MKKINRLGMIFASINGGLAIIISTAVCLFYLFGPHWREAALWPVAYLTLWNFPSSVLVSPLDHVVVRLPLLGWFFLLVVGVLQWYLIGVLVSYIQRKLAKKKI